MDEIREWMQDAAKESAERLFSKVSPLELMCGDQVAYDQAVADIAAILARHYENRAPESVQPGETCPECGRESHPPNDVGSGCQHERRTQFASLSPIVRGSELDRRTYPHPPLAASPSSAPAENEVVVAMADAKPEADLCTCDYRPRIPCVEHPAPPKVQDGTGSLGQRNAADSETTAKRVEYSRPEQSSATPERKERRRPAELTHFRGSTLCRNCGRQHHYHGTFGQCLPENLVDRRVGRTGKGE